MVPETESRAAPVSVLDLSLQDWEEFFVVRTGISKVLSEKGWWATAWASRGVWLRLLGFPLLVRRRGQLATLQPGVLSEMPTLFPSMSFQEKGDTAWISCGH